MMHNETRCIEPHAFLPSRPVIMVPADTAIIVDVFILLEIWREFKMQIR